MKGDGKMRSKSEKGNSGSWYSARKDTQRSGQTGDSPIFEAGDRLHDRPFIGQMARALVKVTFLGKTFGTEMVLVQQELQNRSRSGDSAGRRKNLIWERQRGQGRPSELGFLDLSTERAFGREEEIEQSAPEGARLISLPESYRRGSPASSGKTREDGWRRFPRNGRFAKSRPLRLSMPAGRALVRREGEFFRIQRFFVGFHGVAKSPRRW